MKIRNGFVSNSSSSSFILMFKNIPSHRDDLKSLLFDTYQLDDDYVSHDDEVYPLGVITNSLFSEINGNKKYTTDTIIEELKHQFNTFSKYDVEDVEHLISGTIHLEDYIILKDRIFEIEDLHDKKYNELNTLRRNKEIDDQDFNKFYTQSHQLKYQELDIVSEKIFSLLEKVIKEKYSDYHFVSVEYSDNDGSFGCFMEHDGLLDNISLIRISHH